MLHDTFSKIAEKNNTEFRHRGKEPGRLENLSDAVFGMAITLLLISTTAPTNFDQIKRFTWDLIPFSMCIAFMVLIWYEHFVFFYRYGLRNGQVLVWNTVFLVIVLFYVYALKFLTSLSLIPVSYLFGIESLMKETTGMIKFSDMPALMVIYGLGTASVSLTLMVLYRIALANAKELDLNELEVYDTKCSIRTNLLMACIPLLSVVFAIIFFNNSMVAGFVAGFTYFLYTPVMWMNGNRIDKGRKELLASLNTPVTSA